MMPFLDRLRRRLRLVWTLATLGWVAPMILAIAAVVVLLGYVYYVFFYTMWYKRTSIYGTLVGTQMTINFGDGDMLIIENVTDVSALADDISLF